MAGSTASPVSLVSRGGKISPRQIPSGLVEHAKELPANLLADGTAEYFQQEISSD